MEGNTVEFMAICRVHFDFHGSEFKLQSILDMDLANHRYEIEEVTGGADKQLKVEKVLTVIQER